MYNSYFKLSQQTFFFLKGFITTNLISASGIITNYNDRCSISVKFDAILRRFVSCFFDSIHVPSSRYLKVTCLRISNTSFLFFTFLAILILCLTRLRPEQWKRTIEKRRVLFISWLIFISGYFCVYRKFITINDKKSIKKCHIIL